MTITSLLDAKGLYQKSRAFAQLENFVYEFKCEVH